MTSRMRSAVVLPSSVTGLSSGGAGSLTLAHSTMMSAARAGGAASTVKASAASTAPPSMLRVSVMMSSRCYQKILPPFGGRARDLLLVAARDLGLPRRHPALHHPDEKVE